MKFGANAYFNENVRHSFFEGYTEGDPLTLSSMIVFPDGDTPEDAADQVYRLMNDDNRPNAKTERSLSVGDVLKIIVPPDHEGGTGSFLWLAVERDGFRYIEEPREL
jgi:hypothetical protein